MLLHDIVELAAADRPDDLALRFEDRRVTFAQLADRVEAMASIIAAATTPGGIVFLVSDNHLDVVTAMYAVPRAGALLAFGNTRHTPAELVGLGASLSPQLLLASPSQLDGLAPMLDEHLGDVAVMSIGGAHERASTDLTESLDRGRPQHDMPSDPRTPGPGVVDEHDPAWLIHTSGTTGRAKGVVLTHRSLFAGVTNSAIARPLADDDVYLFPFPLFHVAAYNVVHAHLRRRPVVLLERFDAEQVLELVESDGVTSCSLAPTMLSMLLDHDERAAHRLRSLRQISYGAAAMPLALMHRVFEELPECGLAQGYGMTELSGNAVFLSPDAHRRAATDAPHLLASTGRPGPLVAIRIVDDADVEVAVGEVGEILVRGDQVAPCYWNDPAASDDARLGEWFRTGDVGRLDAEGNLYVVDRKKDIIITGGENVSSREVEDVLSQHPSVSLVAVVGVPDEHWGERICAVVVPVDGVEPDGDDIIEWTRGRTAGFKRPRTVVFVDALPMNASGKIDKREVRESIR